MLERRKGIERRPSNRKEWADRIQRNLALAETRYGEAVAALVAAGQDLIAAKQALPHGHFLPMLRDDIGVAERTAQRLMAIGSNPVLSKSANLAHLPIAISTLEELARTPSNELLQAAIDSGKVNPEMQRSEAKALIQRFITLQLYRPRSELPRGSLGRSLNRSDIEKMARQGESQLRKRLEEITEERKRLIKQLLKLEDWLEED